MWPNVAQVSNHEDRHARDAGYVSYLQEKEDVVEMKQLAVVMEIKGSYTGSEGNLLYDRTRDNIEVARLAT